MVSFQPWVDTADAENLLFFGRGAIYVGGQIDVNEAERVAWLSLADAAAAITRGQIVGAGSIIAIVDLLARQQRNELSA